MKKKGKFDEKSPRELTNVAFVFALVTPIFIAIHNRTFFDDTLWYLIITIGQYIILALVTQNYGKRFVCTVLAETSK